MYYVLCQSTSTMEQGSNTSIVVSDYKLADLVGV